MGWKIVTFSLLALCVECRTVLKTESEPSDNHLLLFPRQIREMTKTDQMKSYESSLGSGESSTTAAATSAASPDEMSGVQQNKAKLLENRQPPSFGSFTKFTIDQILDQTPVFSRSGISDQGPSQSHLHRLDQNTFQSDCSQVFDCNFSQEDGKEESKRRRDEDRKSSPADVESSVKSEYTWLQCTRYKPPKLPSKNNHS